MFTLNICNASDLSTLDESIVSELFKNSIFLAELVSFFLNPTTCLHAVVMNSKSCGFCMHDHRQCIQLWSMTEYLKIFCIFPCLSFIKMDPILKCFLFRLSNFIISFTWHVSKKLLINNSVHTSMYKMILKKRFN